MIGVQFVISLIVVLFLQKILPHYSLARLLMCKKLKRYLHPTNDQLKSLAGRPNNSFGRGRRRRPDREEAPSHNEQFTIPCNLDIVLDCTKVEEVDLYTQYKYVDFKWLLDISLAALVVYVLTELAALWRRQVFTEEFNVGFIWCSIVAFFAVKELILLTAAYWRSEDGGERSMSVSFGFFFLVMAMGILIIDESILDFGLDKGFKQFTDNLDVVYQKMNVKINSPSKWAFKVVLAFISAFLGAIIGFPGIRYANMHLESQYYAENNLITFLFNVSFFSPLLLLLFWVTPLSKDLLFIKNAETKKSVPLISDKTFLSIQIHLFIVVCLLRLLLSRRLLQTHLNSACVKVAKLKKETGRITNIELQRTVARVFYYLSAAALQYMAPIILMLFLALMLRTLTYNTPNTTSAIEIPILSNTPLSEQKKEYAKLIRSLFSVHLLRGVCSYLSWWTLTTYFVTSCFGMIYVKFLT